MRFWYRSFFFFHAISEPILAWIVCRREKSFTAHLSIHVCVPLLEENAADVFFLYGPGSLAWPIAWRRGIHRLGAERQAESQSSACVQVCIHGSDHSLPACESICSRDRRSVWSQQEVRAFRKFYGRFPDRPLVLRFDRSETTSYQFDTYLALILTISLGKLMQLFHLESELVWHMRFYNIHIHIYVYTIHPFLNVSQIQWCHWSDQNLSRVNQVHILTWTATDTQFAGIISSPQWAPNFLDLPPPTRNSFDDGQNGPALRRLFLTTNYWPMHCFHAQ